MLREVINIRQIPGELRRRWFTSDTMDLTVWLDDQGQPLELQLCYDKDSAERAFTWKSDTDSTHLAVDDGEGAGRYKSTPILIADGDFDSERVAALFRLQGINLPAHIAIFVVEKISQT